MKLLAKINQFLPRFKKPSDPSAFKNILVVSNSGLGDTILSTPAIVSLRKSFPDINITFMVNKKIHPLFKGFEYVDDFVLYSSGFFTQVGMVRQLRKKKIDTVFLFHSNGPEDIFFSILSGAKNILKMTDNTNHEFGDIFLNQPNAIVQHDIEKKLDLVRLFNPDSVSKSMHIPEHFYRTQAGFNRVEGEVYLGLQMGAQDVYKMWPVENFIELSKLLKQRYSNINFVLLGATTYEQDLANQFIAGLDNPNNVVNLCGTSPIQDLPGIVNNLDLLVTNDTGTLHLAVALQKKTVSLFGPTNSKVFGPYQDAQLHEVIQVDGSFVNNKPKKYRDQQGMMLIDVNSVLERSLKTLKQV